MDNSGDVPHQGSVLCASWIRRPFNDHLVIVGRSKTADSPPLLEISSFNNIATSISNTPKEAYILDDGDPVSIAAHPSGDDIVYSTSTGCKLVNNVMVDGTSFQYTLYVNKIEDFLLNPQITNLQSMPSFLELLGREENIKLVPKSLPLPLAVGPQKCLAFSADGSRFATGGKDGHLRIFEWPSLRILLDEPRAHKSFRDMDFSLDSEFLASTSVDGSARVWKTNDGVPLTSLNRDSDEKIECCRFSRDGTKPFLFCTVQKGGKAVTAVWDISTWNKIGHKRLLRKPASVLSVSVDGKYLALGSNDGDLCVVQVQKMEICHLSKRLHLGTCISSIEFCPSERVVLSTSSEWGMTVTKLNVPADWKDWQIYLLLLGLFLASAVVFYIFFENSDSFWNFPVGTDQPAKPTLGAFLHDPSFPGDQGVSEL